MAMQGFRRRLSRSMLSLPEAKNYQALLQISRWAKGHKYSTEFINDVGQPTPKSHPQLLGEGEITPGIACDEYISRRRKLMEILPERSLAIFASAPVKMMTDVVPYTFRQDADYLYITGCTQPGGIAVLCKDHGLCMFMPDPDPNDIVWSGQVAGTDAALEFFKADKAFPISRMHEILPDIIGKASRVFHNVKTALPSYMNLPSFSELDSNNKVGDLARYTDELRLIKSASELRLMRQSASIACQSLLQTMLFSRTSPEEGKLSAKVEYECRMRGAQRMAFNPVVGGGANASVIHYSGNDQQIRAGELVLMDIGCEFNGYLSDLTRTWPPSGNFSSAQEDLYDLILETNKECIQLCKPGMSMRQIHDHSCRMLRSGLEKLGILRDRSSHAYHQLNPTAIGHYLGMDVHDSFTVGLDRPLQPGIVVTIEPGVYIPLAFAAANRYRGIGIRIEDEVLITDNGHEVLTASMPKEISDIRSLLNLPHCQGL